MEKKIKQVAVLGLGVFGSTVAKTLSNHGIEVIAIDRDQEAVERLEDIVSVAIREDITDLDALTAAGVADCDVAVIAVGTQLEVSVMSLLNCLELGVPQVIAKAKNKRFEMVLRKVGAHKVIRPEKAMGTLTANLLINNDIVNQISLDEEYSIVEIKVPNHWVGKSLVDLDLRNKLGVNVLGIRKFHEKLNITPDPSYILEADDRLVVIAHINVIQNLDLI
ncbi:trk system potassium uptake protein TrkA [Breznakia blatticola]|uniref:Trk system potassium uptake protein TrkA n=1 Tax=Breznakia blatticola TaxID=1754012 RepID=A0A4R7ZZ05_9FIRM|nr:TrkA family potassium uptake protein [Breznakia blatticola]TDW21000.1 trk system potassium uptake protein TrkA [Breznakia blatticola]